MAHDNDKLATARSPLLVRSSRSLRRAVLSLDAEPDTGWHKVLTELGADLPDLGQPSWHVDVYLNPIGWLGTFRQSRQTGIWFSGRHRYHVLGSRLARS